MCWKGAESGSIELRVLFKSVECILELERELCVGSLLCLISSNAIVSLTTFNKNNKAALYYDVLTQTALILCKMGHLTLKLETINDKNKIDRN